MSNQNNGSSSVGLSTLLFLVFLVLKLTGYIDWSWWWVTSPLWIPVVLFLVVLAVVLAGGAIVAVLAEFRPRGLKVRRRK